MMLQLSPCIWINAFDLLCYSQGEACTGSAHILILQVTGVCLRTFGITQLVDPGRDLKSSDI